MPFSGFCDVERPQIVPVLHRHTRIIAAEYVEMGGRLLMGIYLFGEHDGAFSI